MDTLFSMGMAIVGVGLIGQVAFLILGIAEKGRGNKAGEAVHIRNLAVADWVTAVGFFILAGAANATLTVALDIVIGAWMILAGYTQWVRARSVAAQAQGPDTTAE